MTNDTKKVILPGTPEFLELPKEEQKARIASVLDRASQVDRLHVELPPDVHGEWITNDPVSIAEAQRKGFVVDEVHAPKHTVHGSNRQGDVIFMTIPTVLKEMYNERERERYNEVHGKKDKSGKVTAQAEDIEFSRSQTKIGLPTIDESVSSSVSGEQIQNVLGGKK